jgi:ABC-type enterochelin transport system permease subunit
MIVKYFSALVALVLVFGYLAPVVFKLKEASLAGVMLVGVVMMLVDLWQSLKKPDA